jgi:hypothetical protein
VSYILDAGALIAHERNSLQMQAFMQRAATQQIRLKTTTGVVAQVWRDGAKQARLASLLKTVDEAQFTKERARKAGLLLAKSRTADVIDAGIVELSIDGDEILTSDLGDITTLVTAARKAVRVTLIH